MTTSSDATPSLNYIPGFDGLRGLAVLAVMCHHFGVPGFGGGFIGVDVFFVLSGFLITRILQSRFEKERRVPFGDFYSRRAKRILPAFWAMLALLALLAAVDPIHISPDLFFHSAALAFVFLTQWQVMIDDLPGPLIHLWSLGWEENFYLVWPLVFGFAARRGAWRALRTGTAVAIVAITLVRFTRHWIGIEWSIGIWAFGFFRVDAIILGCAMALFTTPTLPSSQRRRGSEALAFGALVTLAAMVTVTVENRDFFWAGGFSLVGLATFVIADHLRRRAPSAIASMLELTPVRWVGLISYGLYLWHYPINWWLRQRELPKGLAIALSFGLSFALAALSYYTLEAWFRRLPSRRRVQAPQPDASGV